MPNQLDVSALISGLQLDDPKLYQILVALNERLSDVENDLTPLVQQSTLTTASTGPTAAPATFTFIFTETTIRFSWAEVVGSVGYEIRKGADWDTAAFQLRTPSLQADIDPLLVGSYTFLIKAINSDGSYSGSATSCVVNVPALGVITVSKQVIDNNILLSWNAPTTTFKINHYEVYKDSTLLGTISSTFFVRFEAVAGTYTFKVVGVDIVGNRTSEASIDITVTAPPDYVLQDVRAISFDGTKVNTKKDDGPSLIACIPTESWQDHFLTRAWLTPKEQVDDGFPIYIQPTAPSGSYTEVIDYGVILSNIIVTYTFQLEVIIDNVAISISSRVSTDGVSWSAPEVGASFFAESMRYLEVTLNFTATT